MTTHNEKWYQQTDWSIVEDDWQRANERPGDPQEPTADVLSLEEFAFSLLNRLTDEYGIYDDGSFARAIWDTNTPEAMQSIIDQLQNILLATMKAVAERYSL